VPVWRVGCVARGLRGLGLLLVLAGFTLGGAAGFEGGWAAALGVGGGELGAVAGLTSWFWLAAVYAGVSLVPGSGLLCGFTAVAGLLSAVSLASLAGGLLGGLAGGAGLGSLWAGVLVSLSAVLGGLPLALFSGLAAVVLGGRLQGLAAGFLAYVLGGALTVFAGFLLGLPLDVAVAVNPLLASDNLPETLYLALQGVEPAMVPLASAASSILAVAALLYATGRASGVEGRG